MCDHIAMLPTDAPSHISLPSSAEQCRTRRSQGSASTNLTGVVRLSVFQPPGDRNPYGLFVPKAIGRSGIEMDPHVDLTACTQGQASQSAGSRCQSSWSKHRQKG
jgi:hypothetical protein